MEMNSKIVKTNVDWETLTNSRTFGQLEEWPVIADNKNTEINHWEADIQPQEIKK